MPVDSIFRDGRKLNTTEVAKAEALAEENLCTISQTTFIRCVYREDDDFDEVRDRDCKEKIPVFSGQSEYTCPNCGRTIFREGKKEFSEKRVEINIDGVRDFIRELCQEATDARTTTKQNGLSYLDWDIAPVLQVGLESTVNLPILHDVVDEELVEWIRIVNDRVICMLVGESIPLKTRMKELSVPYRTIGELVEPNRKDAASDLREILNEVATANRFRYLDTRADLSNRHCRSGESLKRITWREFEHCVQNLLHYSTKTSTLIGGTSPGSGVPDGAFSLHWTDDQSLFMWDAKFVDLEERDETELAGEYDKIFRHVSELRDKPKYQHEFGGIAGIVLFSPGIKDKHIVRLAETLHAREIPSPSSWNGCVAYFSLNALVQLYSSVRDDIADVRRKPDAFRQGLHSLLTSPARHETEEPEVIQESPYDCVHVSNFDINSLFDYLETQETERSQFDREAYERFLEWNHTV